MLNTTILLTRAEMSRGLQKPFRQLFRHSHCKGGQQKWSYDEALGHARRVKPRRFQWCAHCKKYDVVANFEFEVKGSVPGTYVRASTMREWEFSTGIK